MKNKPQQPHFDLKAQLELRPEQSIELLKALHIVTREGKINQDSRRKLKQVNHLLQFIEPLLNATLAERGKVDVVDHGAGKSYLGFMLYDRFLKSIDKPRHVYGIETREELVARARELAREAKFDAMSFLNVSAADAALSKELPETVDIVTALHACDTATDDAISFALAKKAKYVVLVPCCQAEIAAFFRDDRGRALSKNSLTELWRHPIQAREFGAQITNVLRGLRLEAAGYKVTVTELVGWEHSMKNELIVAEFKNLPRAKALARLREVIETFGLDPLVPRFAA
ncbi:MAG: class I SAM-dependent methyltransferase, partial [Casimicrobium sp.]